MCWICDEVGEGHIWYLNPRNYARQLYKRRIPGVKPKAYGEDPEMAMLPLMKGAIASKWDDPEHFQQKVEDANKHQGYNQVLPLEDAKKAVDLAYPVAAMKCICREMTRAEEETNKHEYTCTGLGVGMFKWERWPERYKGGVHFMVPEEAKEWLERQNKKGFVHTIMTMGGSYIGGICNCDYPDCISIRFRLDYGIESLAKSHYVAAVDYEKCNGCRICVQRCQFGAIKFETTVEKPNIDMYRCFGCGLCETACPTGAITLPLRDSIPALKGVY